MNDLEREVASSKPLNPEEIFRKGNRLEIITDQFPGVVLEVEDVLSRGVNADWREARVKLSYKKDGIYEHIDDCAVPITGPGSEHSVLTIGEQLTLEPFDHGGGVFKLHNLGRIVSIEVASPVKTDSLT